MRILTAKTSELYRDWWLVNDVGDTNRSVKRIVEFFVNTGDDRTDKETLFSNSPYCIGYFPLKRMETTTTNVPESPDKENIHVSFITSNKGQQLLVLNDYLYKCNKRTKVKKYWICVNNSCKTSVHTDLNDVYLSGGKSSHDHEPNPDAITARKVRHNINERALKEVIPIAMIYEQEIAKVSTNPTAVAILRTSREICIFSQGILSLSNLSDMF